MILVKSVVSVNQENTLRLIILRDGVHGVNCAFYSSGRICTGLKRSRCIPDSFFIHLAMIRRVISLVSIRCALGSILPQQFSLQRSEFWSSKLAEYRFLVISLSFTPLGPAVTSYESFSSNFCEETRRGHFSSGVSHAVLHLRQEFHCCST